MKNDFLKSPHLYICYSSINGRDLRIYIIIFCHNKKGSFHLINLNGPYSRWQKRTSKGSRVYTKRRKKVKLIITYDKLYSSNINLRKLIILQNRKTEAIFQGWLHSGVFHYLNCWKYPSEYPSTEIVFTCGTYNNWLSSSLMKIMLKRKHENIEWLNVCFIEQWK